VAKMLNLYKFHKIKNLFQLILVSILLQVLNSQAQTNVSFMEFNVWQEGTSVPNGLNKIRDVIIEVNPDIVGFIEVRNYNNEDWTTKILNALSTEGYHYEGQFTGGDVSLISKYPITASSLIYDQAGSIVKYDININNDTVVVVVAHLDYTYYACYLPRGYNGGYPNWDMIDDGHGNPDPVLDIPYILEYNLESKRDEQIEAFLNNVQDESDPVILMGDFNEPSYADWSDNNSEMFDHHGLNIPWQNVLTLIENDFTDAYRAYFPNETTNPGITWPSVADGVGSTSWTPLADERDRIDYILYKGNGIESNFVSLVGPRASYAFDQPDTTYTYNENFMAENLPWPSDHKATFAILSFSTISGVEQKKGTELFNIYPNPAKGVLNVVLRESSKGVKLRITNTKGYSLFNATYCNQDIISIDTKTFAKGMYVLEISSGEKSEKTKFMVD